MRVRHFTDFEVDRATLQGVTHITALIGLHDGMTYGFIFFHFLLVNRALIKFAMKELPNLQHITFRGDVDSDLKIFLEQCGFQKNPDRSFPIKLRISGILL